jgi:hypothetical protein
VQKEILEKSRSPKLRVYVIWFSMLPTDARSRWSWTGGVLTDSRVVHFWDEQRTLGRWFARQENPQDETPGIVWDAFYLYGPDARWDAKLEPPVASGATVRDEADKLREKLVPLLTDKSP